MNTGDFQPKIRIMLVEDHILVRMGLVAAAGEEPDLEVVAEVEDGADAVESFRKHRPDVVVLDLRMPGIDGVEVLKALRTESEAARILMLSSYGGGDDIARAMQEGASGYVVKGMGLEHLLEAIRTIHKGSRYLPDEIARRMTARMDSDLSGRELEVLHQIVGGNSNKEIAAALGIVEGTVKAHVTSILVKLGAADRTQAATIAIKRKIVHVE